MKYVQSMLQACLGWRTCAAAAFPTGLGTMMETLGEERQRPVQKAKMEIVIKRSPDFHDIIAAEAANGGREKGSAEKDS